MEAAQRTALRELDRRNEGCVLVAGRYIWPCDIRASVDDAEALLDALARRDERYAEATSDENDRCPQCESNPRNDGTCGWCAYGAEDRGL